MATPGIEPRIFRSTLGRLAIGPRNLHFTPHERKFASTASRMARPPIVADSSEGFKILCLSSRLRDFSKASTQNPVRIAMRDKHYNERSEIQNAAMKAGLDLIPNFSDRDNLVVVDYGTAQGANSIEPVKAISTLQDGAIASLIFEDTPFNDSGTLAKTVSDNFSNEDSKIQIVPSLVPLGFYQQVVPTGQADIGFSWSSFNYLENIPSVSLDATASPAEFAVARHKALATAAHTDLIKLLKLRAKETRSGGYFIAAIGGQAPEGETTPSKPGSQVLQAGLMRMVGEGKLALPELMQMALFPSHERTPKEVQAALNDETIAPLWEVESLEPKLIDQPAWHTYQAKIKANENERRSSEGIRSDRYYQCGLSFRLVLGRRA
ncbi:fusarin C cluster-methyltransferase [Fusarium agapanthi]|uniref:Fusarin C cluster-methyltransferase n=1 Tax=Fusarium agapanthi TaxID=1803897 RepID=A0A9P5AYE5_9HYPO|nr:fusarin C cluster-methyltransferase [Fusarium agapanthi]